QVGHILDRHVNPAGFAGGDPRVAVKEYIRTKQVQPETMLALRELVADASSELVQSKEVNALSSKEQTNIRNDMYVASEAIRLMQNDSNAVFTADENTALISYKAKIDKSTKFIPDWVKVAVALALGLGTMVGWKRI